MGVAWGVSIAWAESCPVSAFSQEQTLPFTTIVPATSSAGDPRPLAPRNRLGPAPCSRQHHERHKRRLIKDVAQVHVDVPAVRVAPARASRCRIQASALKRISRSSPIRPTPAISRRPAIRNSE